MRMAATPPRATAAASLDGQVSTATACVLRGAGGPTALCPATVKMGLHAPQTMASVSVRQGSEAPPVRESAPLVFMGIAAARHARSACIAVGPATTSQACVTACLASQVPSAMKCVPVADLGKTVLEFVPVQTMEPVTPLTDLVSVIQGGLAVTARNLVLLRIGVQTASTRATATMGRSAVHTTGNVNALLAGPDSTALRDVPWVFTERTVR